MSSPLRVLVVDDCPDVIVTLVLLGQVFELRARSQTSGAIRALLGHGKTKRKDRPIPLSGELLPQSVLGDFLQLCRRKVRADMASNFQGPGVGTGLR